MLNALPRDRPLALLVLGPERSGPALAWLPEGIPAERLDLTPAATLEEALAHLRDAAFDAVLVDLDAVDARRLGELMAPAERWSGVPIVPFRRTDLAGAAGRLAAVVDLAARRAECGPEDHQLGDPELADHERQVLDALPVAVVVTTRSGDILHANRAAAALPETTLRRSVAATLDRDPPEDGIFRIEIPGPEGEARFVRVRRAPFTWRSEACILVAMRDHTEEAQDRTALVESDRRFRDAFEAAGHGIGFIGLDGRWIEVNEALCRLVGCDSGDLLGTDHLAISHPKDREPSRRQLELLRAGQLPGYQLEKAYVRKDGTEVPVLVSVSLVRDEAGAPLNFVKHVVDLTEKKRAETLLKSLMYAIDENPIGTFIASLDGRIEYANGAFTRITGHAAHSASVADILVAKDVTPAAFGAMWEGVLGGAPLETELRARKADGTEYWIDLTLVPVRDRQGDMRLVAGFLADITEAKTAEASLREGNARLSGILDNVGSGVVVTDHAGRIERFNPAAARMFEYAADEVIGQRISMLLDRPHVEPEAAAPRSDIWSGGDEMVRPGKGEITCRSKSGGTFSAELSVNRVSLGEREIWVAVITDLTERKNAERQLHHAQKMEAIGRLTGGVAHDFNNVLGIVLGTLQLLQRQGGHDAVLRDLINAATEAAFRGADLTKRLLAFSRSQDLDPRLVDVNKLVGGIEKVLRRTLRQSVEITTSLDARATAVMVDPSQLESALLNLAINAEDAMGGEGKLAIATRSVEIDAAYLRHEPDATPGPHVCISIADNGSGIAPDVLPNIFEPFFTTKAVGKGSGLGLSTVYGFVRQSGGHISVDTEEGAGTRFSVFLPCREMPAETAPEAADAPEEEMPGGSETILLVEDDQGFRRVATQLLEELGYVVVPARDGPTALRVLKTLSSVDLLLADIVMPGGMNGNELACVVRETRPDLPVLLTSGHPRDAFAEGRHFPLLAKPYGGATLARTVRSVLDGGTDHVG